MKNKPQKVLGTFAIVMINVIAVDSLRTLPFSAEYGFSLIFFYLLGAIFFFIPIAFVAAELATGWPDKGGIYVWVREAFGERWGFVTIWLQWVYNIVWYPTILSFMAGAFAYLIDPNLAYNKAYMLTSVIIVFWGATIVNMFGMKISSWVSTFGALIGTLIPMFFIILLGAFWLLQGKVAQVNLSWHSILPNAMNFKGLAFFTAILFGLVGMEMSAVHADEVKDPGKTFPRAITYSALIVLFSLIFASLAIAIVVPRAKLNVVTGLMQAFFVFFQTYHMRWMDSVIVALVIIGGISGVAAWVIGPTKGLLVATRDGCAPQFFAKTNKKDVPVVILLLQGIIFTVICSVFLLMPSVSSSYWVLTAMTSQLAMIVYLGMFAGAIYLRYKKPEVVRAYRIPWGNVGIWTLGLFGILSSLIAITLGFVPPSQLEVGKLVIYEGVLIAGIILLSLPPLIIFQFKSVKC